MFGLRAGVLFLAALAVLGSAPATAQTRPASPEALRTVKERQELMATMLESVDRVAPRLGAGGASVNPAHWPSIRDNLNSVRESLRRSRALWPPRSNLGWGSESRATPGLWSLPDAFERHYDAAEAAFPGLLEAVAGEDADGARGGFCRLVAACGSCHGAFRKIDHASLYREGPHWLGRYPGCNGAQ